MLLHLFLVIKVVAAVFAATIPPYQDFNTTSSLGTHDEIRESICSLKPMDEVSYITPWQEIPQRTQGCSVPYYGPQGHGQNPEEVHIVHIKEIDKLMQTLSNENHAMVAITLTLDSAMCINKTVWSVDQALSVGEEKSEGDEDLFVDLKTDQSNTKQNNFAAILRSKKFLPDLSKPVERIDNSDSIRENFPAILQSNNFASEDSTKYLASPSKRETGPFTATYHDETSKRPLVLLLTSDQPVTWQIVPGACWAQGLASRIQVVVEKGSPVNTQLPVEVIAKTWMKRITRKTIQRYARRTFHGVASFTQIRAGNFVRIYVGPSGPASQENSHLLTFRNRNKLNFCDFSSRQDSNLVFASLSVPSSFETCLIGDSNLTRTFVIDIDLLMHTNNTQYPKKSKFVKGLRTNVSSVLVQLIENRPLSKIEELKPSESFLENITVLLRSRQPTKWILNSFVKHSHIHIVVNKGDKIELINQSVSNLEFSTVPITQLKDELIHKAMVEYGSPIRYFFINHASGLTLAVDGPYHEAHSIGNFHQQPPTQNMPLAPKLNKHESSAHPFDFKNSSKNPNFFTILESEMVISCEKSLFEIVLPATALTDFGIKGIFLKDKSCHSYSNGTHFIISSFLPSCGSETHSNGKSSVISNIVYADLNDDDIHVEGAAVSFHDTRYVNTELTGLPVACSVTPAVTENTVRSILDSDSDVTSEDGNEFSDVSGSIYQLELYQWNGLAGSSYPIKYQNIFKINDKVYVRIWMNDAPSAQAVPETCWLSNLPNSPSWKSSTGRLLINEMCPAGELVNLEHQSPKLFPASSKSFIFSFHILDHFLRLGHELYIHCRIGVCISSMKHSRGKSVMCVNPQDYCLPKTPKAFSTAHQLVARGPILLAPSTGQAFSQNDTFSKEGRTKFPCDGSDPIHLYSTISLNILVAISVCSFMIGIALTASLWIIHKKTDPAHLRHHGREYSIGSRTAVMGSSLSPHSGCSSTNSQSAIA